MSREQIVAQDNVIIRIGGPGAESPSWCDSAELACRTSWGSDLWEPAPGDF